MAPITPQFPIPVPGWWKWGLRAIPYVWGVAGDLLDSPGTVQANPDLQWRRAVVHWERTPAASSPEDDAVCTFDLANITNSEIDSTWTDADYATATAAFTTWLTAVAGYQNPSHVATSIRYYRMQFAEPMTAVRRFVPSGPPEKIDGLNIPGSSVGDTLPYQVALSITERTSIPRHWGRFYIPGINEGQSGTPAGHWSAQIVDGAASQTQALYQTLANAELFPVVVSTQTDGVLGGSLLGVTNIQVDDIPDVIRRRRPRVDLYRKVLPPLA